MSEGIGRITQNPDRILLELMETGAENGLVPTTDVEEFV